MDHHDDRSARSRQSSSGSNDDSVALSGPAASLPARPSERLCHAGLTGESPLGEGVSRRGFIQSMGLSGAAAAVGHTATVAMAAARDAADAQEIGPEPVLMRLRVNGRAVDVTAEPNATLLETLRTELHLTGPKEVCDRAACGGCSILVDGRLVASCMMLTVDAIGRQITTVEGIAAADRLHPVQEAFIRHDAVQCGFCTPGLVVACAALLDEHPKPTMTQIRRGLAGNICRCGTYTNVFNAVLDASGQEIPPDRTLPEAATVEEATP